MTTTTLSGAACIAALALGSIAAGATRVEAAASFPQAPLSGRLPAQITNAQFDATMGKRSHVMRPRGYRHTHNHGRANPVSQSGPLAYHGGPLVLNMKTYLVLWAWNGLDGVSAAEQNFLRDVGGSSWLENDVQYTDASNHAIFNKPGALAGVWVDQTNGYIHDPTNAMFAAEATRAQAHFLGHYDPNAVYVIATPTGGQDSGNGFGTQFCAYHSATYVSSGGPLPYVNLPYMPDAGNACYAHSVNPGSGGDLDGVSIVLGHEIAESQTDPDTSTGYWAPDVNGDEDEIADLCAGKNLENLYLESGPYAVQSLYSYAGDFCSNYHYKSFTDMAIGGNGTLWALGKDGTTADQALYAVSPNGYNRNFYATAGYGRTIASDSNGIAYLVAANHQVYYYNAPYNSMNVIASPGATQVSAGPDGGLWLLGATKQGKGYPVYEIGGLLGNGQFTRIGGATGTSIAALNGSAMIVDQNHHVREYTGGNAWKMLTAHVAYDVATNSANQTVYMLGNPIVSSQDSMFKYVGSWANTNLFGKVLAVDTNGYPWVLNANGFLYQYVLGCNCLKAF
jgi:hypothetical protein